MIRTFTAHVRFIAIVVAWGKAEFLFLLIKVEVIVYAFVFVEIFFLHSQNALNGPGP